MYLFLFYTYIILFGRSEFISDTASGRQIAAKKSADTEIPPIRCVLRSKRALDAGISL